MSECDPWSSRGRLEGSNWAVQVALWAPTDAVAHTCLHMLHMQILHCKEHLLTGPSTRCFHDLVAFYAAPCENHRTPLTWLLCLLCLVRLYTLGGTFFKEPFWKNLTENLPKRRFVWKVENRPWLSTLSFPLGWADAGPPYSCKASVRPPRDCMCALNSTLSTGLSFPNAY